MMHTSSCDALSFRISSELYAIPILEVREIRQFERPVALPTENAPALLGMLNIRGDIVPIIDLRIMFGVADGLTANTTTIIVNIGETLIGLVTDSVADAIHITPEQTNAAPPYVNLSSIGEAIVGIATLGDETGVLLNLQPLLCTIIQLPASNGWDAAMR